MLSTLRRSIRVDDRIRLRNGHFAEALPHFQAYLAPNTTLSPADPEGRVRSGPHHATALLGLARCQRYLNPPEVALATLNQLLADPEPRADALLLRGQLELERGNAEEALVWLQRAEDLLQRNARYLTQAKSYDGFCILGPFIVTTDEWEPSGATRIATTVDGERKEGTVAQMRHDPYEIVRHFSHVFAWEPGDIILTGTPGALPLRGGSKMRAEIEGLPPLHARAE